MLKTTTLIAALVYSTAALAIDVTCPVHPTAEWLTEANARAQIEAQGYKIAKFEIDNNCYEVEAYNKDGRRTELHYDTRTLALIQQEVK
ncbi:PepSY domain-containing protein [Paraburkholderia bryophila]|uniref:PepSY domain-containing protein n=1 Tax=Paraburkholderia bryophila TaxID=420952 RepID=UPI00234B398D|nr:PepSY domain-containing protein [Paraburkholderia bryophila]WCM19807.1 PepSY domain-containing protein [Paraburkholderia bryophila]